MRCWVVALLTVAAALAAGLWLGWTARRQVEYGATPARPPRPAAVDTALRAWAEGDHPKLQTFLAEARTLPPDVEPAIRAEIRFLEAVASGSRSALGRVAAEEGDRPAGARARWVLIGDTRSPETRAAMREAFARAYPQAWVLRGEDRSGGS